LEKYFFRGEIFFFKFILAESKWGMAVLPRLFEVFDSLRAVTLGVKVTIVQMFSGQ